MGVCLTYVTRLIDAEVFTDERAGDAILGAAVQAADDGVHEDEPSVDLCSLSVEGAHREPLRWDGSGDDVADTRRKLWNVREKRKWEREVVL